ncbi:hypothetical protein [Pseudomonas aeruginosa]|uniref:hypothetical protein n=1 Tax=Pseudomonas aeruginosa TaxID=287 RepID=UPI000708E673|nr:hypothetical protein [Pseudomonas aeruginosa]
MKAKFIAVLALVAGLAHAAQNVDISVETTDVVVDQARGARWEEYRAVSHQKAAELVATAKASGAACHELQAEKIVVCYFADYQPPTIGMDFQKLRESLSTH